MLPLDNRSEPRKEVLIPAFASDIEDTIGIKCTIREVSRGGCRLVSTQLGDLPNIIHIVPEGFEKPLLGKIVWRDKKLAGVKFIDKVEAARRKVHTSTKKTPLSFLRRFQMFSAIGRPNKRQVQVEVPEGASTPEDLLATVTHEMRTPLTSILGSLGLVVNGALGKLPEKLQSVISVAFRNAGRLSHLINDLLDVKKAEAGKLTFNFSNADIVALARQAVSDNEAYGAKYGVRFVIDDTIGRGVVRMDPRRIEQVLANLISNAAKFSPEGQTVTVSINRVRDKIRVAVKDQGDGLSAEAQSKIFERFEQAAQPNGREGEGTGLGLTISQMIIGKHGSRIEVTSKPGEGATFWFDLAEVQAASE